MPEQTNKAYVIAVDMGYGHQRAAFPFLSISKAPAEWNITGPYIISGNNYPGIPKSDQKAWGKGRGVYEWISRMRELPFLGERLFSIMNYFQRIDHFYPKRDLSKPSMQVNYIYKLIKKGLGKHLIKELNKDPLPIITTFFIPAFYAEEHGYKGPIYCICTDTDISRAWVAKNPKESRIIYFAPSHRVAERLKLYGVPEERVIASGFPLSKELLGERRSIDLARACTHRRIVKLDPSGKYRKKFQHLIASDLGRDIHGSVDEPVSIAFAIGGANAQFQIGLDVIKSLAPDIKGGKFSLNLIAGVSNKIYRIFEAALKKEGLDSYRGKGVEIIYNPDKNKYFEEFNELMLRTDILWTKPSELSFFCGIGLPILIAPTLGSQEEYNEDWLHVFGAGIGQCDPLYTSEWLSDWLNSGILAGIAMNGWMNISKKGVYHIEDRVFKWKSSEMDEAHLV